LSAFLQLSTNAAVVIQWYDLVVSLFFSLQRVFFLSDRFVSLVTASQLLNYATISFTYIRFHNARWHVSQLLVVY
jgi:amino acid transporter